MMRAIEESGYGKRKYGRQENMFKKMIWLILTGMMLAICAGCSASAQEAPDQQKAVAEPSHTAVKVEKQEETAASEITDRPVSHTVKPGKIENTQGRTEQLSGAKASGETEISPATKEPTATKAPATAKISTATKAPATKQPTAGKAPQKTPAKTRQPAATPKLTATKAPATKAAAASKPAATKTPKAADITKAPAATGKPAAAKKPQKSEETKAPVPTKKGHYEKVWVVDRQAEIVVEDVFEEHGVTICNTCGMDITKNLDDHAKKHIFADENFSYHDEVIRKKIGTKTTEIPEKGHWEKVWVED